MQFSGIFRPHGEVISTPPAHSSTGVRVVAVGGFLITCPLFFLAKQMPYQFRILTGVAMC